MQVNHSSGNLIQAPELQVLFPRLTGAGSISVVGYETIIFDKDADGGQLNAGTTADAAHYFKLKGGDFWAIPKGVTDIYVNQACGYVLS